MVDYRISLMVMSGVDDGKLITCSTANQDGRLDGETWSISLGRKDDNDVCLRSDTFASRYHARLHWREGRWWLEDCNSRNGTYIEDRVDDARVFGTIPVEENQLFCLGHTWLRIQPNE
ncbi:MAG: FHA domain-containing protein [Anaerolineae bacterium]